MKGAAGKSQREKAFTLIELMLVVAIIGILAAIAIPKFSYLIAKSRESGTKGNLGALRGSLSIYYGDNENFNPIDNLQTLTTNIKYLYAIPPANLPQTPYAPGHGGPFFGVLTGPIPSGSNDLVDQIDGWLYDNDPDSLTWGQVIVNCTHSDIKGISWTAI